MVEKKVDIEDKKKKKAIIKRQNSYVIGAIIFMVILILVVFFLPGILNKWIYGFDFKGLNFEKTKEGNVIYFSTWIPLTDNNLKVTGEYPLNLRDDPRKINLIKSYIENNTITFLKDRTTYVTVNSDGPKCDNDIVAAASLANFLNGFGGLQVAGALDNETYAKNNKLPYITCQNSPKNTVIMLKPGNQTFINKTSENCYELNYNRCEMLQATEKFELTIVEYYMSFLKK